MLFRHGIGQVIQEWGRGHGEIHLMLMNQIHRLWLHPSLETWDNLQADFFDFYGQALNKLAFDDVVTLIHLLNKVNDGLKSIHLHKETDQE